jgi:drug/metabolite transporter (DMT)-like permease
MQSNALTTNTVKPKLILLIAAFAAVYIIWGSTYLAIKYAIETLPTFLMAGVRFGVAGAILCGWARISGSYERPTRVQWRTSFIIGALLLGIGNGGVVFAEHYISSSVTALMIATTPFWIVLLGWAFMGTGRPNYKVVTGLAVGFVGVTLLIMGGSSSDGGGSSNGRLIGILAIFAAQLGWAAGSLYGSKAPAAKSAIQAAGMQMLAGGVILLAIGTVLGEWSSFDLSKVSATSVFALGYLIVFGAIVAFTAYSWLLKNAPPAKVSTYAYVNPAIAVVLGWLIAGETMTGQMLLGAAVVVVSVALITANKKAKADDKADMEEIDSLHRPTVGRKALLASAQKEC